MSNGTNGAQAPADAEFEVLDISSNTLATNRAQIDGQIATAKAYPRSISKFKETALELACMDAETASSMFYTVPREGKNILGPSIRFAEIIGYAWGNIRYEGNIIEIDKKFVTAEGTCIDLERNNAARVQVKRRITKSNGTRYSEDMIVTTSNAAISIAVRNAIFKVIPFSVAKSIYDKAMRTAGGDEKTFALKRAEEFARWDKAGVDSKKLLAMLGKRTIEDVNTEDLVTLIGLRNAIKEGDTTLEQVLADLTPKSKWDEKKPEQTYMHMPLKFGSKAGTLLGDESLNQKHLEAHLAKYREQYGSNEQEAISLRITELKRLYARSQDEGLSPAAQMAAAKKLAKGGTHPVVDVEIEELSDEEHARELAEYAAAEQESD